MPENGRGRGRVLRRRQTLQSPPEGSLDILECFEGRRRGAAEAAPLQHPREVPRHLGWDLAAAAKVNGLFFWGGRLSINRIYTGRGTLNIPLYSIPSVPLYPTLCFVNKLVQYNTG